MSIRVYELAKKLGLESKELLVQLTQAGEFVRSASSTPVVERGELRDQFRRAADRRTSHCPAIMR